MLEQRCQFGFIDKGLNQIAFIGEMRQYFFNRHQFFETMITGNFGAIQFSHAAGSDFLQQLIFTELYGFEVFHLNNSIVYPE